MKKFLNADLGVIFGWIAAGITGDTVLKVLGGVSTLMAIISYYFNIREKATSKRHAKQKQRKAV
jgi:hypothetical protein